MARAAALLPSRSPPTPLLWPLLLLLLPLLRETGAQDVRVQVLPEVRGQLGGTVELPCHLLSPLPGLFVSLVTWERSDVPVKQQNVAAFHPKLGASFPSPEPGSERLSFVSAKQSTGQDTEAELQDATLALQGLTVEDEGNYTCEFATFPKGPVRGLTSLRVIATPQNHAEAQEVTLSPDPAPVARCISKEGRPPAQISWLSSLDGEAKETQVPGTLAGTVTITSRFILVPLGRADGVTVTCKVEHESLEEPALLPVTLSVRYPPEVSISGYDDNWYLGRTDATLSCDVRSNPEPTGYDWSTTSGTFPTSAVAQGSQLVIHAVDSLFNTTFICTVTNAVGTGRAEQVIFVRGAGKWGPRLLDASSPWSHGTRWQGGGGGRGGACGVHTVESGLRGFFDAKTQVLGNGDPVFWTPVVPGPTEPDGKEEEEEEEEEKAEKGLMLPPPPALEDDMESQLDGSLISRRAVYV
ncbi:nectin-2 isoform X4 [Cebus imitator]|uniref:nectin-2 isoform X4 n=1 Tax=Cebus imitator TaxID=2715852 RepID=UPI000809C141|nr:nectin-2 isoform X4 [Cebus imitator]